MKKLINELRKKIIRKEIANEPELNDICNPIILDNGAGEFGSWDYEPHQKVTKSDILTGQDAQKLPYETEGFDMVILSGVIQYVEDPLKTMKECYRVLRKPGILIIATINKNSLLKKFSGWKDEINKWDLEEFKEFVKSFGFKIMKEKMLDFKIIPDKSKMVIYLKCLKNFK